MAIRVFCSDDEEGAYCDLAWNADVRRGRSDVSAIVMREFAHGAVVSLREMNGYDDSDFYATYYDAESDSFKEVMYASTRGWTYSCGASIDATPEIMAKYEAMLEAKRAEARALAEAREAAIPKPGRKVRVVSKRGKLAAYFGKEGNVFWHGANKFDSAWARKYGHRTYRVGVDFGGDRVFGPADAVEVVAA